MFKNILEMPVFKDILQKTELEIERMFGVKVVLIPTAHREFEISQKNIIIDCVSKEFNVNNEDLFLKKGSEMKSTAKHVAMYLLKYFNSAMSHKQISEHFGHKGHDMSLYASQKIKGFYDINDSLVIRIERIKSQIKLIYANYNREN